MKFCTNCGSQLQDNQKFCPNCGRPIQQEAQNTPPFTENTASTINPPINNSAPVQPSAPTPKKKSSALSIISFILSFTFFLSPLAIVLAILDLVKKNPNKKHGLSIAAIIIGGLLSYGLFRTRIIRPSCAPKKTAESEIDAETEIDYDYDAMIESLKEKAAADPCEIAGHQWKAATCKEPKTCTVCGITEGGLGDHLLTDSVIITEPTCEDEGIAHKKCSICGYIDETDVKVAPTGHTFGSGEVIKPATCKDTGVEQFTCEKCGFIKESSIPVTEEHIVDRWKETQKPTCTAEGIKEGTCKICGKKIQESVPKADHTDDKKWVISKGATELLPGERATHCSICGIQMQVESYSLSLEEKNALIKARAYLLTLAFSQKGLIKQLEFEGFSKEASTIAVESLMVDWSKQAVKKAEDYLDIFAFSRSGLIKQLEFEGFETAVATDAVDSMNIDWKEQAALKAKDYMDLSSFSKSALIRQLKYEGFSQEEAEYGAAAVGY